MRKKSLIVLSTVLVVIMLALSACKKTNLSYEDGLRATCFELGGLLDKENKCILPAVEPEIIEKVVEVEKITTVEVPMVVVQEKYVEVMVTPTPVPSNPALPVMEWSSDVGGEDHTYKAHITPTHYEWWMDPYEAWETGTAILNISNFSQFSYNSVAGRIEILDAEKEVVRTLPNGNFFLRNEWFPVEENFKYISFFFWDSTNPSNGSLTVAIP